MLRQYFAEMPDCSITVKTGVPAAGDIALKLDTSTTYLGNEGYVLAADDVLTITASTPKGMLYTL